MQPSSPSSPFFSRRGATRVGLGALLVAMCAPSRGFAQAEAEKPAPNVLLLVDTSGSMEFKPNGSFPACVPGSTPPTEKSRWIDLIEVMTGTFNGYSCWAQDRSKTPFRDEFTLGTEIPYDFGYVNPYHRALSNGCVVGPGVLPPTSAPYTWPNRAVNTFPFVGGVNGAVSRPSTLLLPSHAGCPAFDQAKDGLLDVYKDMVRFGLMTFDARVGAGTGIDDGMAEGIDGNWSYYLGSPVKGNPPKCEPQMQEVGARNAWAPPWEGRMVAFGPPNLPDHEERNGWIQEVLLSTRPYGATPIAGQLHDAREFLWKDTSADPLDGSASFGPASDLNWQASNCRKTIVILLTDGEPNLDLRPFCKVPLATGETGECPYEEPAAIVRELRDETLAPAPSMAVETYVVGFALGRVTPAVGGTGEIPCAQLTDDHCSLNPNDKNLQACCTLNKIAAEGGFDSAGAQRRAYFAENRTELRAIFTDILDDVISLATRTMPVFSNPGGDSQSKGYKFFSAFDPQPDPSGPRLWQGVLERRRFVCTDLVPQEQYAPLKGDDFAANINSRTGLPRWFYTVIGDAGNTNSIRPFIFIDRDGLGIADGDQVLATQPSALSPLVPPAAMNLQSLPASSCLGAATPAACRNRILDYTVGLTNDQGLTRCPASGCQLFGGIFHSTPTIVSGRPAELLRDESYTEFANDMGTFARPTALYTSTVDGFLHAFNLAPFPGSTGAASREVDDKTNNELWAFIPPAVLPVLQNQYPNTPAALLDGVPIIKDVVAFDGIGNPKFERLQSEAQSGGGAWRTVLLQGFGEGQVGGGYFALDITEPDPRLDMPDAEDQDGPRFLWQLTRTSSGGALFGTGGTPLITTVFLNAAVGGPREVPVAVLPGGDAAPGAGPAATIGAIMDTDPASFKTARQVRNYPGHEVARSLTIVRLDTGEVVRTFRPASGAGSFSPLVFTATDIPAPITGQPKAFPELSGAVADRIFVGDRDGRMWRVDVSSQDSDDWVMEVFYDAFEDGTLASSQPVTLPPLLSVNATGDVTVAFATGDQNLTSGDTSLNRVISLTETLVDNEFVTHVNWIQELDPGYRVTGPMVLFNSGLYYAASRPPTTSTAACDVGQSKVYGAHFEENLDVRNAVDSPSPTSGPAPVTTTEPLVVAGNSPVLPGLVFGVSLEAEPTCTSAEEVIDGNDSFGYGEVRMSKQVKPGRYFLSFGASGNSSAGSGGRGVLEVRQLLDSPRLPVTFESWAMVYE